MVYAAAAAVVIFSLWGALNYYADETTYQSQAQNQDPYRIQASEDRFSGLRQAVPDQAELGYVTDAQEAALATALFDSAQYAVAPRLLEMNTMPDLVLGNFTHPADFQAEGAKYGLRLEHDFGNGVILYRRAKE